jgi:uncharacterized membrane protein YvlD (DUF360 family)
MKNSEILEKIADYAATFFLRYLIALLTLFFMATIIPFFSLPESPYIYIRNFSDLSALPILAFVIAVLSFPLYSKPIMKKCGYGMTSIVAIITNIASIYFISKYIPGFYVESFLFACIGGLLLSLLYWQFGVYNVKFLSSSLFYTIIEKKDFGFLDDRALSANDRFLIKYKKKKKRLLKLEKLLYAVKVTLIKWALAFVILFIAVILTPDIHIRISFAWIFLPVIAFIIAALSNAIKIFFISGDIDIEGTFDSDNSFSLAILVELLSVGICAYSLYFAPEFIRGVYVKDFTAAYLAALIFGFLNICFLCVMKYMNKTVYI